MSSKAYLIAAAAAALLLPASAAASAKPGHGGVPPGHLPPPGECRVWKPGVPPGHQPPPTSCRAARRDAYHRGGNVVYGGREGYRGGRYYDGRYRDDRYKHDRKDKSGCDAKDYRKGKC
ncbi:MAG TPA: hypothetical protein VF589_06660 [Allosphingosinicella sp.]|jgi:hypothetical protein